MEKTKKKATKKNLDLIFDFVIPLLFLGGAAGIGATLLGDDFLVLLSGGWCFWFLAWSPIRWQD